MRQPARIGGMNPVGGFLWFCGSDLTPGQQPDYNFSIPAYLPSRITIKHAVNRLLAGGLLLLAVSAAHATAPIGATPGSFAVSPSGAATYSIPIFVPPGTNGMQPQLSLNYNSQAGNGLLGMGWSIGGLSVIHRCGATIAIDGIKGGVNYDANDKFCLDGERLIWDATSGFYRTQHESWHKVVGVGGTASDPSYFTVTSKDGTVQYYGGTADSRIEAQGKTVARLWALNKIQDRNDNYLTVTYQEDNTNGDYRPAFVAYTGNAVTGTPTYNTVNFEYFSRTDATPLYEGGSVIKMTQRLNKIRINAGVSLVREYRFAYDNYGAVGRSRLKNIQECGSDGICFPSQGVNWSAVQNGFEPHTLWLLQNAAPSGKTDNAGWQYTGDFNGDGKTDYMWNWAGPWYVALSTGTGFAPHKAWLPANAGPGQSWNDSRWQHVADFNGDGKDDYMWNWADGWYVALSNGDGFDPATLWLAKNAAPSGNTDNPGWQYWGDFNGDGKTDYMWDWGPGWYVAKGVYAPADLMTNTANGLGVQTSVTYKPLTDSTVYTPDVAPYKCTGYPCRDIQNATYVASQSTQSNGTGGVNTSTYQYGGLKTHHTAATSLGFRWIQTTDPAGLVHIANYNQTLDCTEGTVASSQTWASGVRVKYVGNTWTPVNLGGGRCYARLASSVEETRELNNSIVSTVNTSYSGYDSYGNPGTVAVDFNDGWSKTTLNTYDNDMAYWQLGKLTYSKVTATAPGQGSEYRESSFTYDSLGRLLTEVIEPNRPSLTLTTTYGYDGFGNRISKTLSGPGIVSRTESQTFTANGQFPLTKTNALGHTESYVHDPKYGAVTSQTGPNGLTTTWSYDGFGRKVVEIRPDGTSTVIDYFCGDNSSPTPPATCPAGTGTATRTRASGSGEVWAYFDILGRPTRTARIGFDGIWVYTDTSYDNLGRQVSVSQPDFNSPPAYYTTYTHDVLGRVLTATAPGNRVTSTTYNGLTTTVTNPKNQTLTTVKNSQGAVVSATDAGGTTSYVYDPFGNLKSVTGVDGAVTSMTYDIRGRKTTMNDPDMGAWSYVYNVLGELTSQTDAKGQTITMAYDKLGRMTSRVLPNGEGTSTWTYDTATKGIGKLASVSNLNANETYTYDSLGRPSTQTTSISGVTYTVTTAYNALGQVDTITYPETGFRLKHIYSDYQRGFLKEVKNDATGASYWKINTGGVDALNRIINETYGNNLISQRQYAGGTGDLNFIKTGTAGNPTSVQNETYGFDELGNVTARGWWDGTAQRNETFGYDNLNRLTSVSGPAPKTYSYYPNGNIQFKTGVGTYNYPTGGVRPHAVTSTVLSGVTTNYTYDANGNMLSGNGRTLTYTSFNKPKTIAKGGITTTLTYDAGFNRLIKSNSSGTTIYIGKLYERVTSGSTVTQKHYIYAGPNLVGAYTKVGSSTNTRYFHTDHLGSVTVITNETGGVVQRLSYDAWGKRRNANGTDATSITAQTTRGFTRHEHDDEVGLVNMNAREFDPLLGRFVTPDTIVQFPYSSQGMNRYTYVNNNPLSFTDPSGHSLRKKLKRAVQKVAKAVHQFKEQVARSTTHALQKVSGVKYVGGLLSTGLLAGTHFGYAYGASTGDWRTVGQAHKQGAILTASAFAFGYVGDKFTGATNIFGHGVVGGTSSWVSGGDFRSGFIGSAFGAFASPAVNLIPGSGGGAVMSRVMLAGAIGGAASHLSGGDFESGFVMAAFGRLFNHEGPGHQYKAKEVDGKTYTVRYHQCANTDCLLSGANIDTTDLGTQAYLQAAEGQGLRDLGTAASLVQFASPLTAAGRIAGYFALSTDVASILSGDRASAVSFMIGQSAETSATGFGVGYGSATRIGAGSSLIFDYLNNQ